MKTIRAFIWGSAIGAALGLLFAPQRGDVTRAQLQERLNQWQNQAQYEMGEGEICGFRLIEDREGEIELVLYYGDQRPVSGRVKFQELFEQFLYQRDVEVTPLPARHLRQQTSAKARHCHRTRARAQAVHVLR